MDNFVDILIQLFLLLFLVNAGTIIRLGLFSSISKRSLKIVIIVTNIVVILFFIVYSIAK